jgi:hypothetical protein
MDEMRPPGQLNEAQERRLGVTCQYIDNLLGDVEQILHEAASKSPFPRHVVNVTPAQTRVLEDYICRIREQLLRALAWQDLHPEPPDIPATRAILSHLAFVDIAIEELKPSYMRGSGAVPESAANELNGVVHELRSVVQGMERYIRQEFGANLESRLKQLEEAGDDVRLIRTIENIVTRHGLVEFRPRIASLASRLAENHPEVALFGRVNSGKSSFLNALLGTDVLPVGVNPITAVPTKLRYGAELRATVAFGSGRDETVAIEDFRRLITLEDAENFFRDAPRFELGDASADHHPERWSWLGRMVVQASVKSSVTRLVAPLLAERLHRYGQTLRPWNEQMSRKLRMMVNSYADAFRAQLNRIRGALGNAVVPDEIERDLEKLTEARDVLKQRALKEAHCRNTCTSP